MYDLVVDPFETQNLWGEPAAAEVQAVLIAELARLQHEVGDAPYTPTL